jgi:tRNA threonylcarbamoyladenosine biosynthesis protein TsaB
MLILAVDTSHKNGSVCLARGDATAFQLLGSAEVDGGMFSAQLVPVIAKLLAKHNLVKKDLQGIAAAVGPGSFTGLRIGLAAVKGFAEVLRIPIAGVSTLEAVAFSAGEKNVIAVLDAGRSEFYVGEYSDGQRRNERLCSLDELTSVINASDSAFVASPDIASEAIAKAARRSFKLVEQPGAEIIAHLGLMKFHQGKTVAVDELDANYVRRDEGLFSASK